MLSLFKVNYLPVILGRGGNIYLKKYGLQNFYFDKIIHSVLSPNYCYFLVMPICVMWSGMPIIGNTENGVLRRGNEDMFFDLGLLKIMFCSIFCKLT